MLITEELNIKINHRTKNYYMSMGYDVNHEIIPIKIKDLPKNSGQKIKCSCDDCGKILEMTFQNYNKGIDKNKKTICKTCIKKYFINPFSDKEVKEKIKKTLLKKYGVDNPLKNKNIIQKRNDTMIKKYGCSYSFNNEIIDKKRINKIKNRTLDERKKISNKIKEKTDYKKSRNNFEKSMINKYGVKNALENEIIKNSMVEKIKNKSDIEKKEIKNKIKKTFLEKYGVDHPLKLKEIKEKSKFNKRKNSTIRFLKKYQSLNIIDVNYDKEQVKLFCGEHGEYEINMSAFYHRINNNNEMCIKCNKLGSYTQSEKDLLDFIQKNYDGEIQTNVRKPLNNLYELDIFLPELRLAFEYNGLYWHSELYKSKNYHKEKTELCEKNDIHLIHIYEDDWLYKQDIVKSRILNLLGLSEKIYARKCEIREINNNKIIKEFLNSNHIQGFIGSKIKIGLFYNGELISLMVFGNLRKPMGQKFIKDSYEMLRFCNKLNINVIGGASKLFKYFIRNYSPIEVISYADRSWSKGSLYEKLGFQFLHKTDPNYYYIINYVRKHRFNFRKDILVKKGYDLNKTEHQIMLENEFFRIYDSGNLKYKYINELFKN